MAENIVDIEAELMRHLRHLCVEIGPRPSGSPGNHAAARHIQDVFRIAGLEVEEQRFPCPAWEDQETTLAIDGQRVEAVANTFSLPCDVSAPAVVAGTVAELEAAELGGRIGVLYGDLTKSVWPPKSWFLASERDLHILRLLEEKRPLALITIQTAAGELERVIEDWEFSIPSATVPSGVGLQLLRQADLPLTLCIKSRQSAGYACNVIARQTGRLPSKIVLCAHYDTKFDTPGAYDNGGGVAVLLTLAQLLSQAEMAHSLEWIAFSGEEYLPLGDDEYLRHYEDQFGQIVAAINSDGVGLRLGTNSITMLSSASQFQDQLAELVRCYPGVVWVDPWPESNHATFAWRGVPSIALTSRSGSYPAHLRGDTIDGISPVKLAEAVSLIMAILEQLRNSSPAWTRGSDGSASARPGKPQAFTT